jgi:hypothetical protein
VACNQFYVTLGGPERCVPLSRIDVSFDEQKQRLKLEERQV